MLLLAKNVVTGVVLRYGQAHRESVKRTESRSSREYRRLLYFTVRK